MKKSLLLFFVIILLSLFTACGSNTATPESLSDEDQVATIVAGTLAAFPTSTSLPTAIATIQSTDTPPTSQTPSLSLEDFPNKVLLGEDESYAAYLINSSSGNASEKTGEIIIYDKGENLVHQIIGSFTFFATTKVSNNGNGEYVLLSSGSYTSRKVIVISLNDNKQAVNDFCTKADEFGDHLFWNDFIIFNNCDTFRNRPWGVGEAPSITAINLKTGLVIDIAKSDLTHQFKIKSITNNNLEYLEVSVEKEEDWQNPNNQITTLQNFDLLSLETNN